MPIDRVNSCTRSSSSFKRRLFPAPTSFNLSRLKCWSCIKLTGLSRISNISIRKRVSIALFSASCCILKLMRASSIIALVLSLKDESWSIGRSIYMILFLLWCCCADMLVVGYLLRVLLELRLLSVEELCVRGLLITVGFCWIWTTFSVVNVPLSSDILIIKINGRLRKSIRGVYWRLLWSTWRCCWLISILPVRKLESSDASDG